MNIVYCQDFFPLVGGAHLWLYEVYSRWPERVEALVTDYSSGSLCSQQHSFDLHEDHGSLNVNRHDLIIDDLNLFSLSFLQKCRQIYRLIDQIGKDNDIVLHCLRGYPEGFVGSIYKRFHPRTSSLVVYSHGEEIVTAETSRQLTWMAKVAYNSADYIIANSNSTKRLLEDFCRCSKAQVISPGVNFVSFQVSNEDREKQRYDWKVKKEDIVILTISRMEPRKNHTNVLTAISELRKEGIPVVGVFASDGEQKEQLIAKSISLGLEKFIRFPGYISDIERILSFAAADVHVLPSIQCGSMIEGYGIVFIEAAASGIPSISGNIGGQKEAVIDGKTGIVTDGNSLEELIAAMRRLALDSTLRRNMGNAGKEWAMRNDWSEVTRKTYDLLSGNALN